MTFKEYKKMFDEARKMSKYCEFCGHTLNFYSYEKDRKLCDHCKRYNYRNESAKFSDLLKKKIKETNKEDK